MKHIKNAIVIGATSGIGREVARLLAEDGCRVGISGRRTALLQELKAEKPKAYIAKTFDVTDLAATITALEELVEEMQQVDLIFLCSGIGKVNQALDFEIEKSTVMTNVLGFTNVIDWSYRFFERQGYGHLAAVSSIAALRGNRSAPSYFASKAYNKSYLEAMRGKAHKSRAKITVTDIRPGFVDTDLVTGNDYLFMLSSLNKAARQIHRALLRRKEVVYITKRWNIVAFVMKTVPKFIYDRI